MDRFESRGRFYLNRELAQLQFNARVLALAADRRMPLLERLRFLCIVDSNLDEFFEIRVAGVKEKIAAVAPAGPDGTRPGELFQQISARAHDLVERQYRLLNEELVEALAKRGIRFLDPQRWNPEQQEWVRDYFFREVLPVLTPIGLDPAHPFPRLVNKSLNFAIELTGKDAFGREASMAILQAPRVLPRVIALPVALAGCEHGFVLLSSIIRAHVDELFPGISVLGCYEFQLTRNSDLYIDEEELRELKSVRMVLQGGLAERQFGDCVRLEVERSCPPGLVAALLEQFKLGREDLYQLHGPVNMVRLTHVVDAVADSGLKFPPFEPGMPPVLYKCADMFAAIRKGDILLHHPYQSFNPVIAFIQQAARDPAVVAIRQTVYRTGLQSEMMELLIDAAKSGKAVTVIVELMARFDEETNINWAQRLETVGAHVVHGVVGHKTHAKMALVVRREEGRLRRYVHLGTGNYHSRTAQLYTDFALFTCDDEITADVNDIFTQLTGLARAARLRRLWQSPFSLHQRIKQAIRNEIHNARAGRKALIMAKMNALLEPEIIALLYEASQAGVRIELIVRGVCTLRPGVPGMSDNIRVRSVLGRFLEHSRVFYFYNDGLEEVYLGSADWMDRNFFRRIEVCFPVLDPKLKRRVIREALQAHLGRNVDAWDMDCDGNYAKRACPRGRRVDAQSRLLAKLATNGHS